MTVTPPETVPRRQLPERTSQLFGRCIGFLPRHAYIVVPCLLLFLYASPLVFHQLPNNFDTLTESFEPLKTLKFIHTKGQAFNKWGAMPDFIYAPLYALPMAYWKVHGDLTVITAEYPYGFTRPFEQQGTLIAVARSAGLLIALFSVALYGRALARMTGSRLAVFLALTLCVATSPRLVVDFVSTKPDGLMLAFLASSMAVYTDIIASTLTLRKAFLLSVLAVCSISCKELTAGVYLPLYLALCLWGMVRVDRIERRHFIRVYTFAIGVGLMAYLLINVVYAPATWWLRVVEWVAGPGKDPAVWSPPGYSLAAYSRDFLAGVLGNLGIGGITIGGLALAITLACPVKHRLLLWTPAVGFALIVTLTAGYLPDYFLSPLNVALVLPVAGALAYAVQRDLAVSHVLRKGVIALGAVLCPINAWTANAGWVGASLSTPCLVERYCLLHVSRQELIHTGNLWVRQSGAARLSYLGFNVDDRPLGEIMAHRERMPDLILISRQDLTWIEEFKIKPVRDMVFGATGYQYKDFPGFAALGYRLVAVSEPRAPRLLDFPWVRGLCARPESSVLIFRRSEAR